MEGDHKSALFVAGVFAAGAVAIILYQHAVHTSQITSLIASKSTVRGNASTSSGLAAASAAGQPVPTQDNLVPAPTPAMPLVTAWNGSLQ